MIRRKPTNGHPTLLEDGVHFEMGVLLQHFLDPVPQVLDLPARVLAFGFQPNLEVIFLGPGVGYSLHLYKNVIDLIGDEANYIATIASFHFMIRK